MNGQSLLAASLIAAVAWSAPAAAQTLASSMGIFIYPTQSQTSDQQSRDDYECFGFAKTQSGYDPMNPPQITAQAPDQGPSGARVAGAARGAAGGAVIGAIAGDAGKGAAYGATLGAMGGGRADRQRRAQQSQQAEQSAQQQMANMQLTFKNAYGACIEARGYSVKY
ncbi:MAG TPA: glycine zipper family protein [Pseudomonadales bacterium]|jgi:hypothetical protein